MRREVYAFPPGEIRAGCCAKSCACSVSNDCGGVVGNPAYGVQALVAARNHGCQSINFIGTDELSPGVGLGDNLGEGVEHFLLLLAMSGEVSKHP